MPRSSWQEELERDHAPPILAVPRSHSASAIWTVETDHADPSAVYPAPRRAICSLPDTSAGALFRVQAPVCNRLPAGLRVRLGSASGHSGPGGTKETSWLWLVASQAAA